VLAPLGVSAVRPAADDAWADAEAWSDEDPDERRIARTVRVVDGAS